MDEIKIGDFYPNGRGEMIGPIQNCRHIRWPFLAMRSTEHGDFFMFDANGRCSTGRAEDSLIITPSDPA